MTANRTNSREGYESTVVDKQRVKIEAVSRAVQLTTDRLEDARKNTESVDELVDELHRAALELDAIVELCDGDKS